jgi:hypothetical protein
MQERPGARYADVGIEFGMSWSALRGIRNKPLVATVCGVLPFND